MLRYRFIFALKLFLLSHSVTDDLSHFLHFSLFLSPVVRDIVFCSVGVLQVTLRNSFSPRKNESFPRLSEFNSKKRSSQIYFSKLLY